MRLSILATLVVAGGLAAQGGPGVIPPEYANQEGNYRNTFPFGRSSMRYQQLHGGMRGKPFAARSLAFRQDGNYNWAASFGQPRTIDLELLMAETDYAGAGRTFASNYKTTPTVVLPRTTVSLPDYSKLPPSKPAAFTLAIPLTQVWGYTGQQDWLWEARVHGNSSTTFYPVDGHDNCTQCFEEYRELGTGCTVTGRTAPMQLGATITSGNSQGHWFRYFFRNGPANAPAAVLIGPANPNLPVPGLCSQRLYTTGQIVVTGTTNGTGLFVMTPASVPYNQAFVGLQLYGQGAAPDQGQSGLPVAATNGTETVLMGLPKQHQLQRVYAFTVSATTAGFQFPNGLIVKID